MNGISTLGLPKQINGINYQNLGPIKDFKRETF